MVFFYVHVALVALCALGWVGLAIIRLPYSVVMVAKLHVGAMFDDMWFYMHVTRTT